MISLLNKGIETQPCHPNIQFFTIAIFY